MKTSLTYSNPGRRFFSCHRYSAGSKQPACNFFQWVDPPTCPRGHEILPTYIKKVKTMEEELRMKKKEKHLKHYLVGSWMFNLSFLISAGFWVTWGVSA
ncbi:hypothetical protein CJ030_MR2G026944 [Morella rubra]|uniref:GRF-type domain-containing protein n=1 Tax=Morella rubra TaxID=262757 RepID=A0A6A1WGD8_9ROSI|nr:hypothetical protein CJ030_MR2G026944 [Morella rubra]